MAVIPLYPAAPVHTQDASLGAPVVRQRNLLTEVSTRKHPATAIACSPMHELPLIDDPAIGERSIALTPPEHHRAPMITAVEGSAIRVEQLLAEPFLHHAHLEHPRVTNFPAPLATPHATELALEPIPFPDRWIEDELEVPEVITWELGWPGLRIREGEARALHGSIAYPALRVLPPGLETALRAAAGALYDDADELTLEAAFLPLPLGNFARYRFDGWRRRLHAQPRDPALCDDPRWAALGVFRHPDELMPRFVDCPAATLPRPRRRW